MEVHQISYRVMILDFGRTLGVEMFPLRMNLEASTPWH